MKQKITDIINKAGIKDVGFCSFEKIKDKLLDCRAVSRIPENSKTVITCLFPYKVKDEKPQFISRYSAVPDYHKICLKYLSAAKSHLESEYNNNKFEIFIDNSPIPEVYTAVLSGLGVLGENRMLINEKYGSYVFIGEIVTDLFIPCDGQLKKCIGCNRCKEVCPKNNTQTDCLSAVSQKKGELSQNEKNAIIKYGTLWGCDICAESCPLNQTAQNTYIKEFIDGYKDTYTYGEDISQRAYNWRGDKVIKRNYDILNG